jgi:hypothetical protein
MEQTATLIHSKPHSLRRFRSYWLQKADLLQESWHSKSTREDIRENFNVYKENLSTTSNRTFDIAVLKAEEFNDISPPRTPGGSKYFL